MAQRVSYESTHSEISAFEFDDLAHERLQLDQYPSQYTALSTSATDEDVAEAQFSAESDQADVSSSTNRPTTVDLDELDESSSVNHGNKCEKSDRSRSYATLKRSARQEWASTIFDALLSLVPLFFLVIAVLCLCLNGKRVSSYGQNIKAITLVSPTIFPIVYAAILGKLLRRIALFKSERSSTVGTLEQLVGSQSFFASIERQFGMRRLNLLGAAIIAAWLLSPLGGQSSLRLLSTTQFKRALYVPILYHSVEGFENHTLLDPHIEEYFWAYYTPMYNTALQNSRPIVDEPRDAFGNVRIPDISTIIRNNDSQSPTDWCEIANRSVFNYTSLFGIPTVDIPTHGNVSFNLESSYWEVRCDQWNASYTEELRAGPAGRSFYFDNYTDFRFSNVTNRTWPTRNEIWFNFTFHTKTNHIISGSHWRMQSPCTASLRLVESSVRCEASACSVYRMRHTDRDVNYLFHERQNDTLKRWTQYSWDLTYYMPNVHDGPEQTGPRTSSMTELWMANPYNILGPMANPYDILNANRPDLFLNLSTILTPEALGLRLQVVMNTFWDATMSSTYRMGNLTSAYLAERNETGSLAWNTTEAVGEAYDGEHYVCDTLFAALTILISWLLFVGAVISVILGMITRAPDILGYVSTLAHDNPYFKTTVPSHLDGLETARALRDVRVIVGDVNQEADVGHIAFASMECGPGRVDRNRLYD